MPYSQDNRLIAVSVSGLDKDKLLLAGFKGHEEISRLFSFHLDLLMDAVDPETKTAATPVQFADVIGKNVTISVVQSDDEPRFFNGIASHFALTGSDARFLHYEMVVVPWTWLLTRYADCKIFHNKTVVDIIQQVFSDRSQSDFKMSANGTYPTLEYTVQYRETDFNFISRMMEQFGIFYFFEHSQGKHTMVIADSSSVHQPCPNHEKAGFNLTAGGLDADDVVTSWTTRQELKSGKCTLADYNFKTPNANLVAGDPTVYEIGNNSNFELFDYPGLYINSSDGQQMAKRRMAEIEASHLVAQGSSVCRAFTSGYKFTLQDHPQSEMNADYVLTSVQHMATVAGNYTTGDQDAGEYSNQFSCIPAEVLFRPERLTPKPFVQGPQTAVVTGTNPDSGAAGSGEEIWVDSFGRVVVLFPWDRKGACSCWVRVSQDWAGQGWGSITIPRIGQEVIVSFLEGDPDRPIITGRVYNAVQTVPYALPANQTRSTFMTRSSKGGSASTYNELRFEDKTGAEQVFVRAQYDYDTQVLHDSREAIGNNRSLTVKVDQMESVGGDLHTEVTGSVFEKVGQDVNTTIAGKVVEKITGDVNRTMAGNYIESVSGDSNSGITGNLNQKVGENLSIQVGENLYEKSGTNYAHQAGTMIHLKAGTSVVIEAGSMLTLMVGGNSVVINPAGVSITGTMVMINSGGSAGSGCGSSPASPTSPASPVAPKDPDKADDGKTGTKLGSGSTDASSAPSSPAAASSPVSPVAGPQLAAAAAPGVAGAAAGAASDAEKAAQQATQAAASEAQTAATAAQQSAAEAQKAAQQAEQQAQAAVNQVKQEAQQAYRQATQAVQQAEQQVAQAAAAGQAAAQQALAQAKAEAMAAAQQATAAVQQAQAKAEQVEEQAKAAAAAAEKSAQAAEQQAKDAANKAKQQGEQAEQQAQQAAQQAQQQAQQAAAQAQKAQQQAQQADQQVKQAASQAQQQAQQASQAAQQSASQAVSQAQKGI